MVAANVAPPTVDVGARGRVAWLWFLVTAACCLPVVTVETVPLYDYYNHVARLHILANLDTSPHLSRFFEADWRVLPNLGFELIGLPLVWLLGSAEMAGRATLLIAIAAFLGGAVALNRAVNGRWSALPLVLAVVVYNYILLMGFMSFLLSLGGFLFAAALWISVAKRPALERLAVGAVAATLLFFFHMVGFAFYCVTIGCVELARCVREQRLPPPGRALIFLGHLVPATVLFVGFLPLRARPLAALLGAICGTRGRTTASSGV